MKKKSKRKLTFKERKEIEAYKYFKELQMIFDRPVDMWFRNGVK